MPVPFVANSSRPRSGQLAWKPVQPGLLVPFRSGRLLSGILLTSFLQWMLNGLTIHLSLWALGIHVSPAVSAIVLGVTAVGVTITILTRLLRVIQFCFLLV